MNDHAGSDGYRSREWFGRRDLDGFLHRSWLKSEGYTEEAFAGRPVIGICNSWSELVNCNVHLRALAESVKRGVLQAGGLPLEFPVMSLGESLMKPTTMLYRNLMAMDVEESIRSYPLDGVVLLTGCDKTNPASIMGAASANIPSLVVTGGPMLNGRWRGREIGSCSDCWHYNEELRAGRITEAEFEEIENSMSRSHGHCMTMGTASTMACVTEALGLTLPGAAAIPAVDSRRAQAAEQAGRQIVDLVERDLKPSDILTREAFENAIRALHAISGSTNAILHLIAYSGRVGVALPLQLFDELCASTPWLVNLKPAGEYLMEDFFYAGGLPAVMAEISDLLHLDADSVMVLKNAGPVGAPGMPEWGHLPIPAKLLKAGVGDLLRISDARMSGTSYGAVVLHVAPESAVGGPLAFVEDGDRIRLSVQERRLDLLLTEAELARRR